MILLAVHMGETDFMIIVYEVGYKEKLGETKRCKKIIGEKTLVLCFKTGKNRHETDISYHTANLIGRLRWNLGKLILSSVYLC